MHRPREILRARYVVRSGTARRRAPRSHEGRRENARAGCLGGSSELEPSIARLKAAVRQAVPRAVPWSWVCGGSHRTHAEPRADGIISVLAFREQRRSVEHCGSSKALGFGPNTEHDVSAARFHSVTPGEHIVLEDANLLEPGTVEVGIELRRRRRLRDVRWPI